MCYNDFFWMIMGDDNPFLLEINPLKGRGADLERKKTLGTFFNRL